MHLYGLDSHIGAFSLPLMHPTRKTLAHPLSNDPIFRLESFSSVKVRMRSWQILSLAILMLSIGPRSGSADDLRLSQPSTFEPRGLPAAAPAVETTEQANTTAGGAIPLGPRRERSERDLAAPPKLVSNGTAVTTIAGALGVVLGLFFVVAWFMRRSMPQSMVRLPSEAVEQLGRAPLAGKQNVHLLRIGGKLLLVVVTPFGAETLTEVTDPDEVERLCALCKKNGVHGPSAEFRDVLKQFEREPAAPGFLGETHRPDIELASAGASRTRSRAEFHA
jgi:flagellar biogenesis protein FliO